MPAFKDSTIPLAVDKTATESYLSCACTLLYINSRLASSLTASTEWLYIFRKGNLSALPMEYRRKSKMEGWVFIDTDAVESG